MDVNVHPTKAEVRFLEQSLVHEVVRRALGDALGEGRAPELQFRAVSPGAPEPAPRALPNVLAGGTYTSRWTAATQAFARPERLAGAAAPGPPPVVEGTAAAPASPGGAAAEIRPMIPLGQFRDTFIIAIDDEGVSIIDQHVAHERVLFERVMERLTAGRLESQRMLEPMILQLSAPERQALVAHADVLERFGFEVERVRRRRAAAGRHARHP